MKLSITQAQEKYNTGKLVIHLDDKKDLPKLQEVTNYECKAGFKYYYRDGFSYIATVNKPANIEIVKLSEIGEVVEIEVGTDCMICGKLVEGAIPKYCCTGSDCGCMGQPIEPIVCSKICYDAIMNRYKTPTPNTAEQTPISRGQGKGKQSITG